MTAVDSNPSAIGKLAGQRVAFTGRLLSVGRDQARKIVADEGGTTSTTVTRRTTQLVVGLGGWPVLPNGAVSDSFRRAEELIERGVKLRILSEDQFLSEVGRIPRIPSSGKQYSRDDIAALTGIPLPQLERWERQGLLPAGDHGYDYQDIVSLRTLAELLSRGVRPEVITRSLHGLSKVLPGVARPLAQLDLIADDPGALIAEFDGSLVHPDGQLLLGFDREPPAALRLTFADREADPDAVDWFEHAQRLEEAEDFVSAADAYRRAIAADPTNAEAFFNLGNVLCALDRCDAGLEMFRLSVALEPDLAEGWFNIADILEEQGCVKQAVEALQQAVRHQPDFCDAYYNLAVCYEKLDDRDEARRCWSKYLKLDGTSEWADIARLRLAAL